MEHLEDLQSMIAGCKEEAEADLLCIEWLQLLAEDSGNEGIAANKLLGVVADLLMI